MNNNKNPYGDSDYNRLNNACSGQNKQDYYDNQNGYINDSYNPADDSVVNPSYSVGPNGESSSPQYDAPIQQILQYNGSEPGRKFSMIGMILGICSIVLALICNLFAGIAVVAIIIDIIAILCGIGGIVLSVMGGNQNALYGAPRGEISIVGMVCGIAGILLRGLSFACIGCITFIRDMIFMER